MAWTQVANIKGPAGAQGATGSTGTQGPTGLNAYNITSAGFTVPPVGQTITVTLNDASWVVVGQMVYVDTAGGGAGQAGALQCTAKTGNQITLLNPAAAPAVPLASSSTDGLLARTSGLATDYVGGDNQCHPTTTLPVGMMLLYCGGGTLPAGWMTCDGSIISRTLYPDLFTAIGTTFGAGDGSTTFALPDMRSRFVLGAGQGTGLANRVLAATGGEENHQLTIAELASHTHVQNAHNHIFQNPAVALAAGSAATLPNIGVAGGPYGNTGNATATNQNTGSDGAHNNMPPFLVAYYIIKVSLGGGATAQAPIADQTQDGLLRKVSGRVTDFVDGTNNVQPIGGSFLTKTAAYTLTVSDSNKYVLCSGGSWTLTLPAPLIGLIYDLRNDMGISGTTGTITLQPTSGTIDGAASLALLPQQECKLRCDGTNWRTFGLKREVILGTQDITSATASGVILLPVGYRYFELQFSGFIPAVNDDSLSGQFSANGGSTWITTGYYYGILYNSSATAAAFTSVENTTILPLIPSSYGAITSGAAQAKVVIWPGNAAQWPSLESDSGSRRSTPVQTKWQAYAIWGQTGGINAFKYFISSGNNIANLFLTVKGVV